MKEVSDAMWFPIDWLAAHNAPVWFMGGVLGVLMMLYLLLAITTLVVVGSEIVAIVESIAGHTVAGIVALFLALAVLCFGIGVAVFGRD